MAWFSYNYGLLQVKSGILAAGFSNSLIASKIKRLDDGVYFVDLLMR
jgi:hypothetical protein